MRDLGATTVEVPALPETDESPVLHYEFARDLDAYLARLPAGTPMRTMAELVAWNDAHADVALKFGQAHLLAALAIDHDAERRAYRANRARDLAMAASTASTRPCWPHDARRSSRRPGAAPGIAARAGYPSLIVPAGYRRTGRRPFGVGSSAPPRPRRPARSRLRLRASVPAPAPGQRGQPVPAALNLTRRDTARIRSAAWVPSSAADARRASARRRRRDDGRRR